MTKTMVNWWRSPLVRLLLSLFRVAPATTTRAQAPSVFVATFTIVLSKRILCHSLDPRSNGRFRNRNRRQMKKATTKQVKEKNKKGMK